MVEPLKSKTMTLKELQKATLKLIYQTKQQLRRKAWEVGMTDGEFEEKVLDQLEADIKSDMEVLKKKGGG